MKKGIIIGAGIGGLTTALALMKKGIDVTIYEQSKEIKERVFARMCYSIPRKMLIKDLITVRKNSEIYSFSKEIFSFRRG